MYPRYGIINPTAAISTRDGLYQPDMKCLRDTACLFSLCILKFSIPNECCSYFLPIEDKFNYYLSG